jgi:hypothetical protein
MRHLVTIVSMVFCAVTAIGGQPAIGTRFGDFSLQDQFDKPVNIRQLEGSIVVLIASDKEGSVQNAPWKDAVLNKFKGKVVLLGVADLRSVPFFLKSKIKKDFQNNPDGVILDWDGVVFTSYLLTKKVSNVILVDRKGLVRYFYAGPMETEARDRLFREIESML